MAFFGRESRTTTLQNEVTTLRYSFGSVWFYFFERVDHPTPYLQFQSLKKTVSASGYCETDSWHTRRNALNKAAGISPLISDCTIMSPILCGDSGYTVSYQRNRLCPMIGAGYPTQDFKEANGWDAKSNPHE
jgi:hypothetical protein